MDVLLLIVVTFVGYLVAYHTYGRYLARRVFRIDPDRPVPAHALADGVDYVPTRKGIVFGHHFTSIAGTGPIVGPAIAVIWGWLPALLWVLVGSIVMGAVHDFGSLVVSLRHEGKSISEIVARYVNPRARMVCFLVVFLVVTIVIAVFAMFIGVLFANFPASVFPIWIQIPIAVALGHLVYKRGGNVALLTGVAVALMYITIWAGQFLPFKLGEVAGIPPTGVWTLILLAYAFVASTLPVTTLLQPRDYLNAWQLVLVMGLLLVGAVTAAATGALHMVAPAVAQAPADAPPLWPFLFVTVACGAISGFHSLVASGTSSKQVASERDALFVGYGSMLLEGALAALVIVAVAGGIGMLSPDGGASGFDAWKLRYMSWKGAGDGALGAAVLGGANLMGALGIPVALGTVVMGVFIVSFAGTTLDTATRIQRYAVSEIAAGLRIHGPVQPLGGHGRGGGHRRAAGVLRRTQRPRGHEAMADVRRGEPTPGGAGPSGGDALCAAACLRMEISGDSAAVPVYAGDDRHGDAADRAGLPP